MGRGGRGGRGLPFPPNGNGFASPDMMGAAVMGGPALGPGQMLVLAPGVTAAFHLTAPISMTLCLLASHMPVLFDIQNIVKGCCSAQPKSRGKKFKKLNKESNETPNTSPLQDLKADLDSS